ncbi:MAG: transcription termination factor NusA [Candidatus Marinimicrobia bacterium CG08_land_8_20_14_0_20_45_22]|nr:MAG: transcription termination factor NusA [Candidatus Marinimicrobia bacterium CG08_land_8_20_14_0_20_45_22]
MINREIIEAFGAIAREKNVDRADLSDIIQKVFLALIEKKYNSVENFDVIVNMDKGEIEIYQRKLIVQEVTDPLYQISVEQAKLTEPDMEAGEYFVEIIDPLSFGRRLITHAKQILNQQIQSVEKNQIYEEFSKKIGQIIIGDVHQIRRDAIFINIGKAEIKMPHEEQIQGEKYRRGESIKSIVKEATVGLNGPEIIVSRASEEFLIKLFENEVPEIYDKTIEIKRVARHPGDRSKVIVESNDRRIDAVGACVGIKGSRIQAIVRELNNEKIDIINYSSEPEILITRALSPAKPFMLEIDEERKTALAIFPDEEISVAIGKNGQNIRLASKVTGYSIDAIKRSDYELTESETIYLEDIEGLTEHNWKLLYGIGIDTAEELLATPKEELINIKGLGEKTVEKVLVLVSEAVENRRAELENARRAVEDATASSEDFEKYEKEVDEYLEEDEEGKTALKEERAKTQVSDEDTGVDLEKE